MNPKIKKKKTNTWDLSTALNVSGGTPDSSGVGDAAAAQLDVGCSYVGIDYQEACEPNREPKPDVLGTRTGGSRYGPRTSGSRTGK